MTIHHDKEPFRVPVRLFELGQVVATPGALEATIHEQRLEFLGRHIRGDWGIVDEGDKRSNFAALFDDSRILSAYPIEPTGTGDRKLWIITEADRSVTTFLLPSEY